MTPASTCHLKRRVQGFACLLFVALCVRYIIQPPCIYGFVPLLYYPKFTGDVRIPADVTVVTAFFNIGRFKKGEDGNVFSPSLYLDWASVYQYLRNPLVVYTDSIQFVHMFSAARRHLKNITKIIQIEKKELWAFDYLDKIAAIYSNPTYPKFHPNTVLPEYSCVQHAKYACMEKALTSDYFRTKYYMWLDIGYFRYLTSRDHDFRLVLPPGFDSTKIAINQLDLGFSMEETPEQIFRGNYVWVGGGLSIGERSRFAMFIQDYRLALEHYLTLNLSNTDQQVLFAMNTKSEVARLKPSTVLQPYVWDTWGSCWFYLGYQCYRELQT